MGLLAAFQTHHRILAGFTTPVLAPAPKWDYDPRTISANNQSWPNTGTEPGHGLTATGLAVVEAQGGPKGQPCVRFPDGGFYDGSVALGIVGTAPRTHLVLFQSVGTTYIELMGWGQTGYGHLYDSMIFSNQMIQHYWGFQSLSAADVLRLNDWNVWLVRAAAPSAGTQSMTMDLWLNSTHFSASPQLDTAASPLRIGSGHYNNRAGERKIARVLIWDRALTDDELRQVRSWIATLYGLDCGPTPVQAG